MDRARSAVTYPGGGTGSPELVNMGLVGDSLVFDGRSTNTQTGRRLVWRCAIGNWDGRVGGDRFTQLESIEGVALEWNAIAAIDDDLLRRCIMGAQALYPGRRIPPGANGGRRGNAVTFDGVTLGSDGGVAERWRCQATLQQGRIASLDAQPILPGPP